MLFIVVAFYQNIQATCTNRAVAGITQNPPYCYIDVTNLAKDKNLFYINDTLKTGLIISLPEFDYTFDQTTNNMQQIIFLPSLRLSTNQPTIYVLVQANQTNNVQDTINVIYAPSITVTAQYTGAQVTCGSIQLTNSTVAGQFTDANIATSQCPMRQESIFIPAGSANPSNTVIITYVSCLGFVTNSSAISLSMGIFTLISPQQPIQLYETGIYEIDISTLNVQQVSRVILKNLTGVIDNLIFAQNQLKFRLNITGLVPVGTTSLDFSIEYVYICDPLTQTSTASLSIGITRISAVSLTFGQSGANQVYSFTLQAAELCPGGATQITITAQNPSWNCPNGATAGSSQTCELSASYNVSTNASNVAQLPGRVMNIAINCDTTAVTAPFVFLDDHKVQPLKLLCMNTTMQSQYLDNLFKQTIDQCAITASSGFQAIKNMTSHTSNVTILTCTNFNGTFQIQDAFINLTYTSSPIANGQVVVTVQNNSPTITAVKIQDITAQPPAAATACNGQSPTFTCTAPNVNNDYNILVTYNDACQNSGTDVPVATLLYPTGTVIVQCNGQCYVDLSAILSITGNTFQSFSYDSNNQAIAVGTLNASNFYIFIDSTINQTHVTNTSRFLIQDANNAKNLYAIVYNLNYQITVGLNNVSSTICQNLSQLNDLYAQNNSILQVNIVGESCGPQIDSVYFGNNELVNITTTNCFNSTKYFENQILTITSASVTAQSVTINSQNNSYIIVSVQNAQTVVQNASILNNQGTSVTPNPIINMQLTGPHTYNITFNTENLFLSQQYRIQLNITSFCGKTEMIAAPFQISKVHYTLPVTATCAAPNQCTYYVNYSLPSSLQACNNANVNITYQAATGPQTIQLNFINGQLSLNLNTLFTNNNKVSNIYINQTYAGTSQSTCFNGQTFEFVDNTNFNIRPASNAACASNASLILMQYFTFNANSTDCYDPQVTVSGNILQVTYKSILNQEYNFTFDFIQCTVSIIQIPATATEANPQLLYPDNDGLVMLNVTSQNIRNLEFFLTNPTTTQNVAALTYNPVTNQWVVNTTSIVSSGKYDLNYHYIDLCAKDVNIKANASVIVPFYVDIKSMVGVGGALTSTMDLGTGLADSNGTGTQLVDISGVQGLNFANCTAQSAGPPVVNYAISLNGMNIMCDANNVYNVTTADLNIAPILLQIVSGNSNLGTPIMARILQKNLEISNFSLKSFPENYVCSARQPETSLTLTFANAPCPPTIVPGSLEYLNYNEVNLKVQFCMQVVTMNNISFKISNLTIQNTSQMLLCPSCFAEYAIFKRNTQESTNAIILKLTAQNITLQQQDTNGVWQNITRPAIQDFSVTESQATFRFSTASLSTQNTYRLFVSYFDVCFFQNRPQNATFLLSFESVITLNIQSSITCPSMNQPTCQCTLGGLTWSVNQIASYSVTEVLSLANLNNCFQNPQTNTINVIFNPEVSGGNYNFGTSISRIDADINQNPNVYTLKVEFSGSYLVKTDRSNVSAKTYTLTPDTQNQICQNIFKDKKFLFVDQTAASISVPGGSFCADTVSTADITYNNVDCCSSDIRNSTTSITLGTLSFTQQSCLDYGLGPISAGIEINAQDVNVTFNETNNTVTVRISLQKTVSTVTLVEIKDQSQPPVTVASCLENSTVPKMPIFICGVSMLPQNNYIVQITLSSGCIVPTPIRIDRQVNINISVPGWDISMQQCVFNVTPTFYINVTYPYTTLPPDIVTVQSGDTNKCNVTINNNPKAFTIISGVTPGTCPLKLINTLTGQEATYDICIQTYTQFDINKCHVFFSDFDSKNVTNDVSNTLATLNSTQNYNMRCYNDKNQPHNHFQLSANNFNSIAFTYTSVTEIPVQFCEQTIGCFSGNKTVGIVRSNVIPSNLSQWLNLEPQSQRAVLKQIANNQNLLSLILGNFTTFQASRGVYLVPELINAIQSSQLRQTLLAAAFNHGLDQAMQYAYFNTEIYGNAFTIYQKASSELSITLQQQLKFVQKLLDTIVRPALGLTIDQLYQGPNITIQLSGDSIINGSSNVSLVQKILKRNFLKKNEQTQSIGLQNLGVQGLSGFGSASVVLNGVPYYVFFGMGTSGVTGLPMSVTLNASFSGTTAGQCFFASISCRINVEALNLVQNGTQCSSQINIVNQVLTCQCSQVSGQGVIYVTGGTFPTTSGVKSQNTPLIILNSCVLVAATALLIVSAIFLRNEKI